VVPAVLVPRLQTRVRVVVLYSAVAEVVVLTSRRQSASRLARPTAWSSAPEARLPRLLGNRAALTYPTPRSFRPAAVWAGGRPRRLLEVPGALAERQ